MRRVGVRIYDFVVVVFTRYICFSFSCVALLVSCYTFFPFSLFVRWLLIFVKPVFSLSHFFSNSMDFQSECILITLCISQAL